MPTGPVGAPAFSRIELKVGDGSVLCNFGGTEGESHLLTGTPPVVVVVEEKALAR